MMLDEFKLRVGRMKIGILTQPLRTNYGGLLQNYALQTVLKRMGHEPVTISGIKPSSRRKIWAAIKVLKRHYINQGIVSNLTRLPFRSKKNAALIEYNMRRFVVDNIVTTGSSVNQIEAMGLDAYIVGSDQVWRPLYSSDLSAFFLAFAQQNSDVKKLAYAASFGTDRWELGQSQTQMAKRLIQLFDVVTVREESAVSQCKEYLNVDATHVLDPTMLLSKQDYLRLLDAHETEACDGGLFVYILDKDSAKVAVIDRVVSDTGLQPFEVLPEKYDGSNLDSSIYPSVYQWIRSFRDAELVVTDSFHGTVFSILFNKPFISIANEKRGATRFTSLLTIFGLLESLIYSEQEVNAKVYDAPDEERIAKTLQVWREKSISNLSKGLS